MVIERVCLLYGKKHEKEKRENRGMKQKLENSIYKHKLSTVGLLHYT